MKNPKTRLDLLLVERGLFPTRAKAQAAVMAGQVRVEGRPQTKPGASTPKEAKLEVLSPSPYVSRGGLKIQAALDAFGIPVTGRVCLDVGASTGGFTDCLLKRGARLVYAVDVGRGQLHPRLRSDPRVVSLEKTHARDLRSGLLEPKPDLATVDVSFISLTMVIPSVVACLAKPCEVLALIKPQFEVGPKLAPKGVVRRPEHRALAVAKVRSSLAELSLREAGLMESPLRGPKGNVELFIHLKPG